MKNMKHKGIEVKDTEEMIAVEREDLEIDLG